MSTDKTSSKPSNVRRGEPVRQRVLDAAERLLSAGPADFSMRDLAAAAGVSFATPFNHFGSKGAIMLALSERRIDAMIGRLGATKPLPRAADRVIGATEIGADIMLEQPRVNRAMLGWISSESIERGQVLSHSTELWSMALGQGEGLLAERRAQALNTLPRQLAFAFRGVLSFWAAGELKDDALLPEARAMASLLLSGFVGQALQA